MNTPNPAFSGKTHDSELMVRDGSDSDNFAGDDSERLTRLGGFDTLEPGTYWRAKLNVVELKEGESIADHDKVRETDGDEDDVENAKPRVLIHAGDVHLLVDVNVIDGDFHSVELLTHPRQGARSQFRVGIGQFYHCMEPCHDHQAVRDQEKAQVVASITEIQEEMAQASVNPMANEEIRKRAEKALKELEDQLGREMLMAPEFQKKRKDRLAAIHRRAARRSANAGNPLAVRQMVVSDSLADLIDQQVTSDAVSELQAETKRRQVIAETAAKYISDCTRHMGRVMESLTPYYSEQAQVALAKSKGAITRAKDIEAGLASLGLYTGDSVDVVDVLSGAPAADEAPLVLYQAKKFMDECLCVVTDVEEDFDWQSQKFFFEQLKTNATLRDLVLPSPRCVVSMAVTRRFIDYGHIKNQQELLRNLRENSSVFLLVRNGENVHAVYSTEPSHEASPRLFPTTEDLNAPFVGIDGTRMKLSDLQYVEAKDGFDAMALHYKRFLILLCGLDHRLQLFGRFYPAHESLKFMSLDFQSRYFQFVRDDDAEYSIGHSAMPSIERWFADKNKALVSGSRLVTTVRVLAKASPGFQRRSYSLTLVGGKKSRDMVIARKEGDRLYVELVAHDNCGEECTFKAWLDDRDVDGAFLCLDTVLPSDIQHYLLSRNGRAAEGIRNILTLKRAHAVMQADAAEQAELRAYLRNALLAAKVMDESLMDDQILLAINAWRSAHRGAPAPSLADAKAVRQILNVLYPKDALADGFRAMAEVFARTIGAEPLRLVQTGKDKLVLYTQPDAEDVATVRGAMHFGWVRRRVLVMTGRGQEKSFRQDSSRLIWCEKPDEAPDERVLVEWEGNAASFNGHPEPAAYKQVIGFLGAMDVVAGMGPRLELARAHVLAGHSLKDLPFADGSYDALVQELAVEASKKFDKFTYAHPVYATLPIGLVQSGPGKLLRFLVMRTNAFGLIRVLASQQAYEKAIELMFRRYRPTHRQTLANEYTASFETALWRLRDPWSESWLNDVTALTETMWPTCKPGGVKRRDMFGGGKPKRGQTVNLRQSTDGRLSHNRALDRVMDANDLGRRRYHDELSRRYPKNWPWTTKEDKKKMNLPYVRQVPAYSFLSPLVWSSSRCRSHAGRYFPAKCTD